MMNNLDKNKLNNIVGGSSDISAPIINAVVSIVKLLIDAGKDLGSSFRRIGEHNLCPLK